MSEESELLDDGVRGLSLVAFGDWGESEDAAYRIRIREYLETCHVDGVLLLGDNFYPHGVESVDDPKFQIFSNELVPTGSRLLPFYAILGNHDCEGNANAQIEYSRINLNWNMPHNYYLKRLRFFNTDNTVGYVGLWCIDSELVLRNDPQHKQWLQDTLDSCEPCDWKILVSHVPLYTAGFHCSSRWIKMFRDKIQWCVNKFDAVVAAHDHCSQVLRGESLFLGAGSVGSYIAPRSDKDPPNVTVEWFDGSKSPVVLKLDIDANNIRYSFVHLDLTNKERVLHEGFVIRQKK